MAKARILRENEAEVQRSEWGELVWYASGKLGNSGKMTVGKCVLRPGRENPPHRHANCEEVLHVLTGTILHFVEGAPPVEMKEGDTITLPPNLLHNAKNTGKTDAVLFVAFSSPDRKVQGE